MLACLEEEQLSARSKSAICSLIMHLFIDSEPLQERVNSIDREWDDIGDIQEHEKSKEAIRALMKLENGRDGLEQLQVWIEAYFSRNREKLLQLSAEEHRHSDMLNKRKKHISKERLEMELEDVHKEMDENEFVWRLLEMVSGMFRFGFYFDHERRETLVQYLLHGLAQSVTVVASLQTASHSHEIFLNAQATICDVLLTHVYIQGDSVLSNLLRTFHGEYLKLEHRLKDHPAAHLSAEPEEALVLSETEFQDK